MFRIISKRLPASYNNGKYVIETQVLQGARPKRYSTKRGELCPPPVPEKGSAGVWVTVSGIVLIIGGVTYYAHEDGNFRKWMGANVPYTDQYFKFVFQEDSSYGDNIMHSLVAMREWFVGLFDLNASRKIGSPGAEIKTKPKDYHAPPPAFEGLAKDAKAKEKTYTEIRIEKKGPENEDPKVTIGGDKRKPATFPDTHPVNIAALEKKIQQLTQCTVEAYNNAVYAIKNYSQDVETVVENSVDKLDESVWTSLKMKSEKKVKCIEQAHDYDKNVSDALGQLKQLLAKPDLHVEECVKRGAEENVAKIENDLENARKELRKEVDRTAALDKYWSKVEEARCHFKDELRVLFPNLDVSKQKLNIDLSELDLFIIHTFSTIMYLQKELCKTEALITSKIDKAISQGGNEHLVDAKILVEVERCKRQVMEEFRLKCLELRAESEKELRSQLKLQSEAFQDHLDDAIKVRENELKRDFTRAADEELARERDKYKHELNKLVGRVLGMDQAMKIRMEIDKTAEKAQALWSACYALFRALRTTCPGYRSHETVRPLATEVECVRKACYENDELCKTVLKSIPKEAVERGVFTENALRERFLKVDKVARRLTLVSEKGSSMSLYFLSYLQSKLLIKGTDPIPAAELNNEVVDFTKMETNEILDRARYWVDRADFSQALKYMNLLKGGPRSAASEWMNEARIYLETLQATQLLMAHASSNGLKYL